jgi:hypothetical protein
MPTVAVISEGQADDEFLKKLIAVRRLNNLEVLGPAGEESYGRGGFQVRLEGLKLKGIEKHKAIVIVADNDDDPRSAFRSIQNQIRDAGGYGVPEKPYQVSGRGEYPPVAVVMLPASGEQGSLDTLCWSAANEKYALHLKCVGAIAECIGADERTWGKVKLAKLKVQCLLSSICKGDPYTPLKCAWWVEPAKGRRGDIFPLDNPVFNPIAEFLHRIASS